MPRSLQEIEEEQRRKQIWKQSVAKAEEELFPTMMTFGKHKGVEVTDLPYEYLQWCITNLENKDTPMYRSLQREFDRRWA